MSGPVRVLLVDDDALVRQALTMMLDGAEGVRVVGEADDGEGVPRAVQEHRPDVVLMDIRMPVVDGLTATERLRSQTSPGTGGPPQVVVLTTLNADDQVLRALRAGAAGFLLKDTPPAEIARAIRLVAAGEAMLSPAVTRRLIDHVADPARDDRRARAEERLTDLTEREREVAVGLGRGGSNAEIGAELHMSVATVKAHVSSVLQKLDLNNRVQVALLAHDAGLVDDGG
ncbi:response regulator transcription factor [Patulibacter sp.]|uniref:response regulator n=1 Tax=Patulibacter sp. TaxID=1912859 RepID=UPI00271E575A|nr:response regulator transcription factor [Patulibacter sp.]MDO9407934.1 response regulator transcription factor [Patulibacter sp.]